MDLKPENILINSKGELYLCDFGNSLNKKAKPNWKKQNFNGSDAYSSPEQCDLQFWQRSKKFWSQLNGFEFEKIDYYSLGVVLFVLVFNSFPFKKKSIDDVYYKSFIQNKHLFWKSFQNIRTVSTELVDLLDSLLSENPSTWITGKEIFQHKWVQKHLFCDELESNVVSFIEKEKKRFLEELKWELQEKYYSNNLKSDDKRQFNQERLILGGFSMKNQVKIKTLQNKLENLRIVSSKSISNLSNDSDDSREDTL